MHVSGSNGQWRVFDATTHSFKACTAEEANEIRQNRLFVISSSAKKSAGVGAELKRLFATIKILPKKSCNCNAIAQQMDRNGPDWCENNRELLLDLIAEEARKRRLPFVRSVVSQLISLAIRRTRKNNSV